MKGFVERKRDKDIFLSALGFGQGNYNDHTMQSLAQKMLVDQAAEALFTIAKDVKIQIEFNPTTVSEYRLLDYKARALNREDFNNDAVDTSDIGAGHSITAIYKITAKSANSGLIDESRYQAKPSSRDITGKYGFLKMRYKRPESDSSELITTTIANSNTKAGLQLANEIQFSTSVVAFAQLLRGGQYTNNWGYDHALKLAQSHQRRRPLWSSHRVCTINT
ncbi:MAG: DUF3520 domain-containing protein [Gammaproteobacteria bacterium]|nr:DUF3520 domain-containing protein [Gammaproteobacteria bacterium]